MPTLLGKVVQALLEAGGADANAQDNNGWNCLHVSIANNHEKVFFAVLAREHDSPPTNIEVWSCFLFVGSCRVRQTSIDHDIDSVRSPSCFSFFVCVRRTQ